jgi:hypothetical protein
MPALSQSAASFDTQTFAPTDSTESPAPEEASPANMENASSSGQVTIEITTPSRYVGPAELNDYLASVKPSLSIYKRTTDPFGLLQDPSVKPAIKRPAITSTRSIQSVQTTPFSDIVKLIKVTTIMPGERRFLVGTRSIKQGDRFPIRFRGKTFQVEVKSVSSSRIDFNNLENGETATLTVNLLPKGMVPGSDGITAPGMVPEGGDIPINLDR